MQRELSPLLLELFDWGKALVTVTSVITTPDLRQATVWVSVLNSENTQSIIELLNKRAYDMYEPLSHRLKMKHTPKLEFKLDDQGEELLRIDELIDQSTEQGGKRAA